VKALLRVDDKKELSNSLIDLEEGPRMMSRVMDVEPTEVTIGMQVSAHVGLVEEKPAVVFYNKEQGDKEW